MNSYSSTLPNPIEKLADIARGECIEIDRLRRINMFAIGVENLPLHFEQIRTKENVVRVYADFLISMAAIKRT